MIYVNREESIIRIEGAKVECLSDLYNLFKSYIRSGIAPIEIVRIAVDASRAVEWEKEGDQDDQSE